MLTGWGYRRNVEGQDLENFREVDCENGKLGAVGAKSLMVMGMSYTPVSLNLCKEGGPLCRPLLNSSI